MILKLINKKHVKEILYLLNSADELYFAEICKNIPEAHNGSINRTLQELYDFKMVSKREEGTTKLSKTFYSISILGMESLKFYELEEKLEEKYCTNGPII
ncbi:DNA-binding HxlR family transcriptional regulator [Methanococcus maripaludis]|uniref:DNA-binding HxlR family transcriptional regulator n=1 Tax=Methanococcus maripaludis TaxID=39152 RepID=A0A7J9NKC9_METMI|nr:transcriptional regulator [Methanococcus maripaludis]MBA2841283.1 DNA-binding HxlR family transcriptional regulator [Methanococcus maripaludis]